MTDQQRNAGNIGDIVKHVVLAEALTSLLDSGSRIYIDTHAGFYSYGTNAFLKSSGKGPPYNADRQWTLRVVWDHLLATRPHQLGVYGDTLRAFHNHLAVLPSLPAIYPGSLCLAAHVVAGHSWELYGFDTGLAQIENHAKHAVARVRRGDGYAGAAGLLKIKTRKPAVTLCDPFWTVKSEIESVQNLIRNVQHGDVLMIWLNQPVRPAWTSAQTRTISMRFESRAVWGNYLKGATMMLIGLDHSALNAVVSACQRLVDVFKGQTDGAPPASRSLDLTLDVR